MKIIYEQGDIVYNLNNFTYGIVLAEYNDVPKIIELSKDTFINNVPKGALQYKGHIDITKALKKVVDDVIFAHPTEKGETERQIQTAKTMIEKMVSCYDKTEKGGEE